MSGPLECAFIRTLELTIIRMQYKDWSISYDNNFARDFYASLPSRALPAVVNCCRCCSTIVDTAPRAATYNVSLRSIRRSAENCLVCKLLLQAFQQYCKDSDGNIDIQRTPLEIRAGVGGTRLVRFCVDPGQCLQTILCTRLK